jgi:hypothetical protein
MGDRRLTNIVASCSSNLMCEKIFALIELGLSPQESPSSIYKTLLLLTTVVLYGSDGAVAKVVALYRFVNPLINYNSALVKRGFFSRYVCMYVCMDVCTLYLYISIYTFIPLYLYFIPLYLYTFIPLYLYTYTLVAVRTTADPCGRKRGSWTTSCVLMTASEGPGMMRVMG